MASHTTFSNCSCRASGRLKVFRRQRGPTACKHNYLVGREKIGPTGVRTPDSLNLVRVRYHYAPRPVVGGIKNSNTSYLWNLLRYRNKCPRSRLTFSLASLSCYKEDSVDSADAHRTQYSAKRVKCGNSLFSMFAKPGSKRVDVEIVLFDSEELIEPTPHDLPSRHEI